VQRINTAAYFSAASVSKKKVFISLMTPSLAFFLVHSFAFLGNNVDKTFSIVIDAPAQTVFRQPSLLFVDKARGLTLKRKQCVSIRPSANI
jgi:hypothetical protein